MSNEWISVKDRLPDKGYDCWLMVEGKVERGWYFVNQQVFGHNEFHMFMPDKVTHWQQVDVKPPPPSSLEKKGD